MRKHLLLIALGILAIVGCAEQAVSTPTAVNPVVFPTASIRELPVTFTPVATQAIVTPTPPASPTPPAPTATPMDFGETAVELHYRILALGLDRRLQGTIGSQIIFADENSGVILQRSNQGLVLLELQQTLPELDLEPIPDGCDTCVYVSYNLPLSHLSGEGWLQDPVLLASVENLLAAVLGPHFPPDTIIGLRRSASPYAPAHTIALTADGQVWRWLATEGNVDEPLVETAVSNARATLNTLTLEQLSSTYEANCAGVPAETLYLNNGTTDISTDILCPGYTLPATLLPLYLALDAPLQEKLDTLDGPARPPAGFPLAALLDYRRADGARLTIYQDGFIEAQDAATAVYTSTLAATDIFSLTTHLLDSGLLSSGLTSFTVQNTETETTTVATSLLLLRGPDAVYDGRWQGEETAVAPLDTLLNQLIGLVEENEGTAVATATPTPAP
ncbi:MAG: hypothetical protein H6662_03965 [Ardenticatenaceae bacterium]|nr:hypothetical protein [Anaerolineales bacterium]MCB8920720.1 hypothetical protein [Ardenticatenaceae bacterium]MCB8989679.1 hypothetical protein [Ardenticatenaceae bacterium]MCB9002862.1 hypothetical protein [Ardenticatenaceae bacterium]